MNGYTDFFGRLHAALANIPQEILSYDQSEFWMIRMPYEYIEHYAVNHQLLNTAIALPLSRGLHNGTHRKSSIVRSGISYKLPYVFHCLIVCRMLVDLNIPLSNEEADILLASALCHDMVEDIPFPCGGTELFTQFGLDSRVYETVKLVSKRKDFTEAEEAAHFRAIAENKLALLIKLSDRGHNVEDLYNMSVWKVHEYVDETKKYIEPMGKFGLAHYPELTKTILVLLDKISLLTNASQILVDRFEIRQKSLMEQLAELREENKRLRHAYELIRKDGAVYGIY